MNTQVQTPFGDVPVSVNVIPAGDNQNLSSRDDNSVTIIRKPQRPLSAYNLFFRMLRDRLLNETESGIGATEKITAEQVAQISTIRRYVNEKRCHKKTHGKYGFKEMTSIIITKWKNLDAETRQMFEVRAAEEKKKYVKAMKLWTKNSRDKEAAANKTSALDSFTSTTESSITAGKRKNVNEVDDSSTACPNSSITMNARRPDSSDSSSASTHPNELMPQQSMTMHQESVMMPQREFSEMLPHANFQMPLAPFNMGSNCSEYFGLGDDVAHFGCGFENNVGGFEEALYAMEDAYATAQNFMVSGGHPIMNKNMLNPKMMDMNMMDMNMMDMNMMMMMQQGEERFDMYDDIYYPEDFSFNHMSFDDMMRIRMRMRAPPMTMNAAALSFPTGRVPMMAQQQRSRSSQRMPSAGFDVAQPQAKRRRLGFPGNEDDLFPTNSFSF